MENEVRDGGFEAITLLRSLRKYWILVLAVTVALGGLAALYTRAFSRDSYVGSASFWVNGSAGGVSSSATMGAAQMATNYIELVDKDILLRHAVQEGELASLWGCTEDAAVRSLRSMLSAGKSSGESFIFTVSVTAATPLVAYQATNAVQYAMIDVVNEVNGYVAGVEYLTLVGEVHSVDDVKQVSRPYARNVCVGVLAGFVLSLSLATALYVWRGQSTRDGALSVTLGREEHTDTPDKDMEAENDEK